MLSERHIQTQKSECEIIISIMFQNSGVHKSFDKSPIKQYINIKLFMLIDFLLKM